MYRVIVGVAEHLAQLADQLLEAAVGHDPVPADFNQAIFGHHFAAGRHQREQHGTLAGRCGDRLAISQQVSRAGVEQEGAEGEAAGGRRRGAEREGVQTLLGEGRHGAGL